jgi:hypothetical protein
LRPSRIADPDIMMGCCNPLAAVHMATMTVARRLAHVDDIAQQNSAEWALNKLARTFAVQMEVLKRYRTGGEVERALPLVVRLGSARQQEREPQLPQSAQKGRLLGKVWVNG